MKVRAAISLMGGRDEATRSGPRVIASALDDEGNAVEADYTSTDGTKRLDAARDQIENIVSTESMRVLSSIEGPKGAPEGVSEAVVNSFVPLVIGDHDDNVRTTAFQRLRLKWCGDEKGGEK